MKKGDLAASARVVPQSEAAPQIDRIHARIASKEDKSTWKRLNIRLPEDLLVSLKKLAIDDKTTPEKIAIELLEQYVAQEAQCFKKGNT